MTEKDGFDIRQNDQREKSRFVWKGQVWQQLRLTVLSEPNNRGYLVLFPQVPEAKTWRVVPDHSL